MLEHFTEYNSSELNPKDFMGLRGKRYISDLFFNHSIYKKISNSIKTNSLTLILGNPISGKSRIAYDNFKKFNNYKVLKANVTISELDEYGFDNDTSNTIIFFDDIDEFFNDNPKKINSLLTKIISKEVKCVITCRKGPEYGKFKYFVDKHILNEFKEDENLFIIPRFSKNYKPLEIFLKNNRSSFRNPINEFDGNLGSLIVPLSDMRKRFESLQINDERLPLAILLGLKLHYNLLNYELNKSTYDNQKIKFFCEKYLGEKFDSYEWDSALNVLLDTRTDLNFIEVNEHILIEEVYLDIFEKKEDVIFDLYNKKRLKKLLNSKYTTEEKIVYEFPLNTRDFNNKIRASTSFKDGYEIFKQIENPDAHSFMFLANLTDDDDKIATLYEEMKSIKSIDEFFIPHNFFIGKFKTFKSLLDILVKVGSKQLEQKNSTTIRLSNLAQENLKENLAYLFGKLNASEIFKNKALNDLVLRCVEDKEDFETYLKPILKDLGNFKYDLKKGIIKSIIKTKEYEIAIPLVNDYLKDFDFYNELGNCYQNSDFKKSLYNYIESLNYANFIHEFLKSYININRVIYLNKLQKDYLEMIETAHTFLKKNHKSLENDFKNRNSKYLQKYVVLNLIENLEFEEKVNTLKAFFRRYYITISGKKEIISALSIKEKLKLKE